MAEHIVAKTSDIDEGTGKTFTVEGQIAVAVGLTRKWLEKL